jgi:hypothetical protein
MSDAINPRRAWHGVLVPDWLLWRTDVSMGAKLVYARLARYADARGVAYPTVATLAAEIGLKERQTRSLLAELKEHGLIRQELDPARRAAARYTFLTHAWMTEARPAGFCPSGDDVAGPAEGQTGRGADRQDSAPLTGSIPPLTPAENCPPDRQNPAPKESQGRGSPEESHLGEEEARERAPASTPQGWLIPTDHPDVGTALVAAFAALKRGAPGRARAAKAPPPDPIPMPGTRARQVFDAILGDHALRAIVRRPGEFAERVTDPRMYPGVDVIAAVLRAGAHAARNPGRYTDGERFLGTWLRGDAEKAAQTQAALAATAVRPIASAPARTSTTTVRTGYLTAATRAAHEAEIAAKKAATR